MPSFKTKYGYVSFKTGPKKASKVARKNPLGDVKIPKGKRAGERFSANGKTYEVISFVRNGKRVRYARKAATPKRTKAGKHRRMTKTGYGVNTTARTGRLPAMKRNPTKTLSKKVGKWRCECNGRTVTCAGAKHTYANAGTACAVYKKITSLKAVEAFVGRYGKKKTKAAVVGKKAKKAPSKRRNPCGSGMKRTRRNAPMSRSEAAALRKVLKRHNYI